MEKYQLTTVQQRQMVIDNLPLVNHILKDFTIEYCEYEEYVQIGRIGLIKAVATFDETKSNKFSAYAVRVIKNEILMYIRNSKKFRVEIPFSSAKYIKGLYNEDVLDDADEDVNIAEFIPDPRTSNFPEELEKIRFFEDCINIILNCFPTKRKLGCLLMIAGKTQQEIGELVEVTQTCVSKGKRRSLEDIKKHLVTWHSQRDGKFHVSVTERYYKLVISQTDRKISTQEFYGYLLKNKSELLGVNSLFKDNQIVIFLDKKEKSFEIIAKIIIEMEHFNFGS